MSQLTINQQAVGGQLYELKLAAGQTIQDAVQAAEKDGLDQVYFQVGERLYFAEGDGLDLSELKKRALPSIQFEMNGLKKEAQILAIDDEVNTALEGSKAIAKAAGGLLLGGLIGGSVTSAIGFRSLNQGVTLLNTSAAQITTQGAKTGLSQLSQAVTQIGQQKLIVKISKPLGQAVKVQMPANFAQTVAQIDKASAGMATIEAEIAKTTTGVARTQQSLQTATQSTGLVKKGLYIAAIGVGLAGLTLAGGAVYGAYRGQQENALEAFKGNAL